MTPSRRLLFVAGPLAAAGLVRWWFATADARRVKAGARVHSVWQAIRVTVGPAEATPAEGGS